MPKKTKATVPMKVKASVVGKGVVRKVMQAPPLVVGQYTHAYGERPKRPSKDIANDLKEFGLSLSRIPQASGHYPTWSISIDLDITPRKYSSWPEYSFRLSMPNLNYVDEFLKKLQDKVGLEKRAFYKLQGKPVPYHEYLF